MSAKKPGVADAIEVNSSAGWVPAVVVELYHDGFWFAYPGGKSNVFDGDEGVFWRWPGAPASVVAPTPAATPDSLGPPTTTASSSAEEPSFPPSRPAEEAKSRALSPAAPPAGSTCRGCGATLLPENYRIADGCPCNSPRGVNHGLVPMNTCTCIACDPAKTGSSRYPAQIAAEAAHTAAIRAKATRAEWERIVGRLREFRDNCTDPEWHWAVGAALSTLASEGPGGTKEGEKHE